MMRDPCLKITIKYSSVVWSTNEKDKHRETETPTHLYEKTHSYRKRVEKRVVQKRAHIKLLNVLTTE